MPTKTVIIINKTKGIILADKAEIANTPLKRLKGLLGRSSLNEGEGLIIVPCSSIHTFFMRFSIDAIFIDKTHRIVALANSLPPWRLFSSLFKGELVIELPAETLKNTRTSLEDLIEIVNE